jgi:hypothetical protein
MDFMRVGLGSLLLAVMLAGCSVARGSAIPQSGTPQAAGRATSAGTPSCTTPGPGVADPNAPHGLMVWLDSVDAAQNTPGVLQYLPSDPNLCGASIVVLWSGVDRGPAVSPQYDFSRVEKATQPWLKAGKKVNLLFIGTNEVGPTDTATPAWVLAQTGANQVDLVPCPDPGTTGSIGPPTPVYWEPGYANPWHAFINRVIAKYATDTSIGYMRFGLGAGAEDFPQHGADANCFPLWQKYGMSAKRWATFSSNLTETIAGISARHNSIVQQVVALNPFNDPAAPYNVSFAVATTAAANGIGFGTENLGSGSYGTVVEPCTKNASVPYWCKSFETYAGKVPLEFQPINFTLKAGAHVAPLTTLLPYAILNHAQLFELYPQEWLTADDPQYPTYAAHHIAWQNTLTQAAAQL